MFAKCILHIGTEKTGTTTLQGFLAENRAALREKSVCFPTTLGAPGNRFLATYAMEDGRSDDGRRRLGIATEGDLARHRRHVEGALRDELTAAGGSVLLLSSEHCHSRLLGDSEVRRLQALLARYCRRVSVIVYIRPQHELAVSLYSTALRIGYSGRPILPEVASSAPYYNYRRLLDRWAGVFGEANVIARIYCRAELPRGDICADFLRLCEVDGSSFTPTPDTNRPLSGEAQAFLERMNPVLPRAQRGRLIRLLENLGTAPGAMPSRTQAEQFLGMFAESNEAVRARWFPERRHLFEVDFSTYPDQPHIPSLSEEEAFSLFTTLWQAKQHKPKAGPPRSMPQASKSGGAEG